MADDERRPRNPRDLQVNHLQQNIFLLDDSLFCPVDDAIMMLCLIFQGSPPFRNGSNPC